MKKLLLLLLVSLVLLCGCQGKRQMEEQIKVATNSYYQKYVSGKVKGLNVLEITLGDIRKVNDTSIDLSKLDKCDDSTEINAQIENNEIVNYDIKINFK